ncbi:hypothetical protein [Polynucleobacter sp. MWH-Berg-3C6]|uniref:hypothetical protein n=1 Tax=Polynucleobacter sp. MWH-Berg-3C6 TaxID=1855882 RepID=UPI001C0CE903|nr:hypothetical protein [Polynucleobacter sp. MWH-Berg-3C6]MBU3550567.1 hypothetical protein [Polynucleobacter sp. MWH-Berg-3C6]
MDMKKLILVLLLLSTTAQAREEWQGEFSPPSKFTTTRGHRPDIIIHVKASVDKSSDGGLSGAVTLSGGQLRCSGEAKIESGKIQGNSIFIRTEPLPIHNCGRFIFKGSVTEDSWSGEVPWNEVSNELVLKKSK